MATRADLIDKVRLGPGREVLSPAAQEAEEDADIRLYGEIDETRYVPRSRVVDGKYEPPPYGVDPSMVSDLSFKHDWERAEKPVDPAAAALLEDLSKRVKDLEGTREVVTSALMQKASKRLQLKSMVKSVIGSWTTWGVISFDKARKLTKKIVSIVSKEVYAVTKDPEPPQTSVEAA